MGSEDDRLVALGAFADVSKEMTSSTRIAFGGSSEAERSKAPLRCDW